MRTITIDIINERALNLLRELEVLKLIRLRKDSNRNKVELALNEFKGAMSKQPLDDIDKQLNQLRNEWE